MIQERYCSFEVAKLLKEKGFNEEVRTYYQFDNETRETELIHDDRLDTPNLWSGDYVSAPTHQMAMDWLNETHNIFLIIEPYSDTSCYFSLWQGDIYRENPLKKDFPSYGETVEAALKYCLTELI